MDNQDLNQLATQVRRDIVRMVHGASSGHPGGCLGMRRPVDAALFRSHGGLIQISST